MSANIEVSLSQKHMMLTIVKENCSLTIVSIKQRYRKSECE